MINNKKSVAISLDFIFSSLIVIALIVLFSVYYNFYSQRLDNRLVYQKMEFIGTNIAESLISSGGVPENWEKDIENTKRIGLTTYPRTLSTEKLNAFTEMDYNTVKDLLKISDMDFMFRVYYPGGVTIAEQGVAIIARNVVTVQREVTLNNEALVLEFSLRK